MSTTTLDDLARECQALRKQRDDLLEACEAMLASATPNLCDHPTMCEAWDQARAAVAKAKGRTGP